MNRRTFPITAAAAFFVIALSGIGQSASAQDAKMSIEDQHFLMHAVPAGMAEVAVSKLAAEKAQNDQVKQFAQRMITDHSKANDQIMKIAQQKGVQPPQELSPVDKAEMQHLKQLSGAQFDQAYMGDQVIDHDMAIYMYQRESKQGQDQDVKTFASQTLPTLKDHHQSALEITGQNLTAEQ